MQCQVCDFMHQGEYAPCIRVLPVQKNCRNALPSKRNATKSIQADPSGREDHNSETLRRVSPPPPSRTRVSAANLITCIDGERFSDSSTKFVMVIGKLS